jgi:hypothetical protein
MVDQNQRSSNGPEIGLAVQVDQKITVLLVVWHGFAHEEKGCKLVEGQKEQDLSARRPNDSCMSEVNAQG